MALRWESQGRAKPFSQRTFLSLRGARARNYHFFPRHRPPVPNWRFRSEKFHVSHIPHEIAHIYNSTPLNTPAFTFRVVLIWHQPSPIAKSLFYANFSAKRAEMFHCTYTANFAWRGHSDDTYIIVSYQMFFKPAIKVSQVSVVHRKRLEISIL